jgi:hypothetical protein
MHSSYGQLDLFSELYWGAASSCESIFSHAGHLRQKLPPITIRGYSDLSFKIIKKLNLLVLKSQPA